MELFKTRKTVERFKTGKTVEQFKTGETLSLVDLPAMILWTQKIIFSIYHLTKLSQSVYLISLIQTGRTFQEIAVDRLGAIYI